MTNFISEHANEILTYVTKAEAIAVMAIKCEFYNMPFPSIKLNGWKDSKGISVDLYLSASDVKEWLTDDTDYQKEDYIVNGLFFLMRQEEMRRNAVLLKIRGSANENVTEAKKRD